VEIFFQAPDTAHLITTLRNQFDRLRLVDGTNHAKQPFVFKGLSSAISSFVMMVQSPYSNYRMMDRY